MTFLTFGVLFFALCLLLAGFTWFCFNQGKRQLLDLEKNTGRPYRAETIDLLQRRAAKLKEKV